VGHVLEVGPDVLGLVRVLLGAQVEDLEADRLVLGREVLEVGVGDEQVVSGPGVLSGAAEELAGGADVLVATREADVVDPDECGLADRLVLEAALEDLVDPLEVAESLEKIKT